MNIYKILTSKNLFALIFFILSSCQTKDNNQGKDLDVKPIPPFTCNISDITNLGDFYSLMIEFNRPPVDFDLKHINGSAITNMENSDSRTFSVAFKLDAANNEDIGVLAGKVKDKLGNPNLECIISTDDIYISTSSQADSSSQQKPDSSSQEKTDSSSQEDSSSQQKPDSSSQADSLSQQKLDSLSQQKSDSLSQADSSSLQILPPPPPPPPPPPQNDGPLTCTLNKLVKSESGEGSVMIEFNRPLVNFEKSNITGNSIIQFIEFENKQQYKITFKVAPGVLDTIGVSAGATTDENNISNEKCLVIVKGPDKINIDRQLIKGTWVATQKVYAKENESYFNKYNSLTEGTKLKYTREIKVEIYEKDGKWFSKEFVELTPNSDFKVRNPDGSEEDEIFQLKKCRGYRHTEIEILQDVMIRKSEAKKPDFSNRKKYDQVNDLSSDFLGQQSSSFDCDQDDTHIDSSEKWNFLGPDKTKLKTKFWYSSVAMPEIEFTKK